MKFGIRKPSLKKRIAARTSVKRYIRHSLGLKAPRGWGWLTNPKKAAYNRVYHRTTRSCAGIFLLGVVMMALLIAGCSIPTPQVIVVEITRVVEHTVEVTRQVTQIVTATPEPPTETPTLAPTTSFTKWTADQVIEAFKAAGLEAENPTVMTRDDFGRAPYSADKGIHFFVPSLCSDCGGRVFSFPDLESRDLMETYYVGLGRLSAASYSWVFVRDNILVQINGDLPDAKAAKYKEALENLK